MQKKYQCVYTVHKIKHLAKKKTHIMLHKKNYCKIQKNVKVFTSFKD